MSLRRSGLAVCLVVAGVAPARSSASTPSAVHSATRSAAEAPASSDYRVAAKKKKKPKKKPAPPPAKAEKPVPSGGAVLDLSAPAPKTEGAAGSGAPVLDLSNVQDSDAARRELMGGAEDTTKKSDSPEGAIDFGGGLDFGGGGAAEFDFGEELGEFQIEGLDVGSPERARFDDAVALMSDESYEKAAVEFRFFLEDPKYREFRAESEYQLGKALYKQGFLASALKRFQAILDQGPSHRRYRKSVEWLFFISRKMADETPVLAVLAQFRNVTWPKAYQNEYRYLLSKYLFVQAERLEVARLQEEELIRNQKQDKTMNIDFGAIAGELEGGGAMDFGGGGDAGGGGGGLDFGGGGGGGMDFGGGGGGAMDFGGGLDFGAGDAPDAATSALEGGPIRDQTPTTAKQAISQGLDLLTEIEPQSKFFARAKYLEGLMHYLAGADQKAVEAFQAVVRELNPKSGQILDPMLREMAFLSLARIHYGYKQFNRSVYYYDLIDRDSENWLTALFEASWAYYQRGDFEKALGNLLTLHSPFFEREYFPESQIVKSIIYFEACRYPETRGIVDDFLTRFTRVMNEIKAIAESKESAEQLFERVVSLREALDNEGQGDDITARLVSLALNDPQIRTAQAVVEEAKQEVELLAKLGKDYQDSLLGRELKTELAQLLVDKQKEAGDVTRKKFERELFQLKNLLAQALRIKIEVARAEREILQAKQRGESTDDQIEPAEARIVVDDEHVYWPYEGEYWRDELGTYELDFSMCRRLASR